MSLRATSGDPIRDSHFILLPVSRRQQDSSLTGTMAHLICHLFLVLALAASANTQDILAIESLPQLKTLVDESSLSRAVIVRFHSSRYTCCPCTTATR